MATLNVWLARGVTREAQVLGVICSAAYTGKTAILATCKDKHYLGRARVQLPIGY